MIKDIKTEALSNERAVRADTLPEFVYCEDAARAIDEHVRRHYGDLVEVRSSVHGGAEGFYTRPSELAEMIHRIIGEAPCGRHLTLEMFCEGGAFTVRASSDEYDVSSLGTDMPLAAMALGAGVLIDTDGDSLLITADTLLCGKGIVSAIGRSALLRCLEEAYFRDIDPENAEDQL